jgi:hypothetical protein
MKAFEKRLSPLPTLPRTWLRRSEVASASPRREGGGKALRRETKLAAAEISGVEVDGSFHGYASLFGETDLNRDLVLRGAFLKSIAKRGAGGIRMLFQHDPAAPIGVWREIREDARGLFVSGRLMTEVAKAREVLALTGDSPTHVALSLSSGQLVFPASQVPSANANTLNDYEEGTWTPVLTFATPGNLSVAYTVQTGLYTKVGRLVTIHATILTSSFTHTTASGDLKITGFPFTSSATSFLYGLGGVVIQGVTMAGYTNFLVKVFDNATYAVVDATGSGVSEANVATGQAASGTNKTLEFTVSYLV